MHKAKMILNEVPTMLKSLKNIFNIINGNKDYYNPKIDMKKEDDNLNGKKIIFLGSSITYGAASKGISFVEYLTTEYEVKGIKEAKSGTTLAGKNVNSYLNRLRKLNFVNTKIDAVVIQLSTNDARFGYEIGEMSQSFDLESFDTETTLGAIEYIIKYVHTKWHCPIIFYTCIRENDLTYKQLVNHLYPLKTKWDIHIIDIFNNDEINKLAKSDKEMMVDDSHPTKKGYCYLYTPILVKQLDEIL
ncbi:SGNH/GDSL hydrolase family protein [Staphylococcus capitis]|uniref:SGNH/GDSL hydrolase family protein n=1 Tax=Staphylococcus capitis TaxID=29388 RepID=UPI0003BF9913|nr:SGNH/GDSL hydrolase family protein [Staphylococcus capitis]MBF8031351.1 SGNH/GDSL hydrolase family protein [Staphylococcus capitis]MBF8051113.1 SGNH/GDSL hydrolase family protein [Staphylococcus capitis]PNM98495.1 SGNH/GDSL hydrolase family protein [Staphylococcus capitis]CDI72303.1 GDSL-like protein [Staphylococcus capitis CR01]CQD27332.1 GDSL-like protein [Staphylococcus capitis]